MWALIIGKILGWKFAQPLMISKYLLIGIDLAVWYCSSVKTNTYNNSVYHHGIDLAVIGLSVILAWSAMWNQWWKIEHGLTIIEYTQTRIVYVISWLVHEIIEKCNIQENWCNRQLPFHHWIGKNINCQCAHGHVMGKKGHHISPLAHTPGHLFFFTWHAKWQLFMECR